MGVCINVTQMASQGPLHSPLSVACLLSSFFNLVWFYFFSLLNDFQTLLSSENISANNILYVKLVKVELLWVKWVWTWLLPPRPLTPGPVLPSQDPDDSLERSFENLCCALSFGFLSLLFPMTKLLHILKRESNDSILSCCT